MSHDIPQDEAKELQTNKRLAIGIGVFGVLAFGAFYVCWFLVMILKPGLVFRLLPEQSFTTKALSDGQRTYLLSQKIDMSKVSFKEKRQEPRIMHYLSALQGAESGKAVEIPAYASATGGDDKIVFFSDGTYRVYDGTQLVEVKSPWIGKNPQGIVTPAGLYVLSSIEGKLRLSEIRDGSGKDVPLPNGYVRQDRDQSCPCPCTQLLWYQGRLCMFWSTGEAISWTIWNGSAWEKTATSPFSGGFQAVAGGGNLYFFHREGEGLDRTISMYVYGDDSWTGPVRLPRLENLTDWDVFMEAGKPRLFVQQFFRQTLYTIEKGTLEHPLRLADSFNPFRVTRGMLVMILAGNVAVFLVIFGCSAVINKYKKQVRQEGDMSYEFASVFRRFLAVFIDTVLIFLPPGVAAAFLFSFEAMAQNPLRFVLLIMGFAVYFLLGGFLYHSLLEGLLGVTLGKKICGIRVLKSDFTSCTLGAGFLRNVLRFVDGFFYYLVGVVALAGTVKWQRIGDLAAATVVVRDKGTARSSRGSEKDYYHEEQVAHEAKAFP